MLHVLLLIVSIWMAFWGTFTLTIGSFAYQRLFFLVLEVSLAAALILIQLGHFRRAGIVYLAGTWLWATLSVGAWAQAAHAPVR